MRISNNANTGSEGSSVKIVIACAIQFDLSTKRGKLNVFLKFRFIQRISLNFAVESGDEYFGIASADFTLSSLNLDCFGLGFVFLSSWA